MDTEKIKRKIAVIRKLLDEVDSIMVHKRGVKSVIDDEAYELVFSVAMFKHMLMGEDHPTARGYAELDLAEELGNE